ncbi:MAG: integrase arm-type DNA-binding domain-containing protein [Proteobacteria bacterium]|nr:integrase arm-type DNA-binding domain-containing protein [Pseudomonadota bacterium]
MARKTERLSDLTVRRKSKTGTYADGRGLYLQVSPSNTKSWLFRFMLSGRERWMGLGPYPDVTLAAARDIALKCRHLLRDGVDPIENRRAKKATAKLLAGKNITFQERAEDHIDAHKPGWRNPKHAAQWRSTLKTYAYPIIGQVPVGEIDTGHVMRILEPIWQTKTETANRLRQRIEAVIDGAIAFGLRSGDNPARWRGHLQNLLPSQSKVRRVQHFKAMAYTEIPGFFRDLRQRDAVSACAMSFSILTAARSGEVRGVTWDEIDMDQAIWTIPEERTKSGRPHRIPLSSEALAVLNSMKAIQVDGEEHVFPGRRPGRQMSENTMRKFLQNDMQREGLTVHGFRSTFRDWAAEQSNFPREVAEAALAHALKDKTEAAYQRGDLLEKRRDLMEAWANYCSSLEGGKVVEFSSLRS